jgi:hypothetical protein
VLKKKDWEMGGKRDGKGREREMMKKMKKIGR